jgi:hypothetical protein
MDNVLQLTVAKLELKQLELIDRLSKKHNDYVIRVIMSTITDKFVAVNGDWEFVTGFKEAHCVDKSWDDVSPKNEIKNIIKNIDLIKNNKDDFKDFNSNIIKKDGTILNVNWKGKYFPEINGLVLIGRVRR